ncbi:putative nucleotidyltransferase, ribonuclease H [Tanacetum coccineum]
MSKERFPGRNAKLKQRGDGPFRIVQCMGNNAYKVELLGHYDVSATFNVKDLSPFHGENELHSRTTQLVQQLQLRLERVEAPRQNHNEPENEDSEDEEFNPFHVNGNSESNDEDLIIGIMIERTIVPNVEAFLQLHNFAERDLSVADYTEEFDHLMLKCGIADAEEQTISRYLLEKHVKKKEGRKSVTYGISRGPNRGYATNRDSGTQSTKPVVTKASYTPQPHDAGAGTSRTRQKSVQCFTCKGHGHISIDCPNQRVFTLVEEPIEEEYQEFDSPPIFDEPLEQEDVIYGDTGELLVIRRALVADSTEDSVWLRHNIFHTWCTSHGKVCDVIIDNRSCENVVSKTMVKKLSLKTEKHPRSYKLLWLQKGKSVHVDQRCLVHFSIGDKYQDEVWCDVVPMDACHLLLGRPWQFDRRTIHDGM